VPAGSTLPTMAGEPASTRPPGDLPKLTRFEVVRRLGEGGAGFVYEATDRGRDGRVALKMLRVLDGEMLLRLKEEFRSLQDIEHRNLIRLFELSCEADKWFFTMELVEGRGFVAYVTGSTSQAPRAPDRSTSRDVDTGSMSSSVASGVRSGTLLRTVRIADETKLRESMMQLAQGLVALHAAGKVHRDIKPSNVMVANDGRVVILDLGLVRDAAEVTVLDEDVVVGTISHMAPEQAAGTDVGPPADWYSVGAVLYQCLTGRHPFEGDAFDVLTRKQNEDPPRPRELQPNAPVDLDALCMDLLAREPSKRPTGAAVLRRLEGRSDTAPPAGQSAAAVLAPFVGRSREMDALREAFERARAGNTTTLVVEGESGVGKSAMVKRFTRGLAEKEDVLVLAGRCYEREDVPYKAIDGVIDSLSNHLSSLSRRDAHQVLPPTAFVLSHAFPVLRRVPAMELGPAMKLGGIQESRSLLFGALRDLFANLARQKPLVVVIDDMQWADADSLTLLAELLRAPAPPMLLIATARATRDSASQPVHGTSGPPSPFGLPGDVRVLPLPRLTEEEGLELVTMLAGNMSASVARRIAAEAGGHPLFVDELVRHSLLTGGKAPTNVLLDDALVARVARLDPDARALLELLAVAGVALPQDLAMRAAGLPFAEFANLAQTLRAAHLARTHGWRGADAIEPYHDRVREAVAARLDSDARIRLHTRLAEAFESATIKDADALSTHWLGARDEAKAGEYALVAAEQALAAFAFERAERLFERALALAKLDDRAKQALRLKRADALASAGRGRDAAKVYFDAAKHATPDAALDLRRRGAEELLTAGRIDEGDAALRDVLAAVGISLPSPLVALLGLLFVRFILLLRGLDFRERKENEISASELTRLDACLGVGRILSVVDTIRGAYFQTRALVYALACGEPKRVSFSLSMEAVYIATPGGARRAARSAELRAQARAIAQRTDDVRVQALVETATGYANFVLGRFADALTHNDRGAQMLQESCPGAFWDIRTAQLGAIWPVGWMGNLNELARRTEQISREAEQRGDIYALATVRTGVPNLTWLRKGDVATARANVLDATKQWTQRGYQNQHYWSFLALTRIELYEGDARAAHARVWREWSRITRALIHEVRVMHVESLHLRGSAALSVARDASGSERSRMILAAERDARKLAGMRWTVSTPFAQVIRAGALALRGDADRASVMLDAASRGFDELGMSLHAASAKWHFGKMRGGTEGRALVASAESWMASQAIVSPAQMAAMIAPGFGR
jgi:tRNA A-37 threonylcarbamoyl transferase component Bud32